MALPCSDMPSSRSSSPQWQYTHINHIDSGNTQKVLFICRIMPREYSYSVARWIPQRRKAKTTPSSNLRRWQPAALSELELFVLFVERINDEELTRFWGRRESSSFAIWPTAKQHRRPITIYTVRQLPHIFVLVYNRATRC
jgi:hypothetical protein